MKTLLLRLAAPLQSWGVDSKFERRATLREPTKSGVIGLCAAALGIRRGDGGSIRKISALKFGVRIDQPGTLLRDFHMAHTWDFSHPKQFGQSFISERFYLADAVFLVGLSGDESLLREIDAALRSPVFPLFLGRRSCPPAGKLSLGVADGDLLTVLRSYPSQASKWYRDSRIGRSEDEQKLEIIIDSDSGIPVCDFPLSYSQQNRHYGYRFTGREQINVGTKTSCTSHNAMALFGGN